MFFAAVCTVVDEEVLERVVKRVCIENNKCTRGHMSPMTDSAYCSYVEGALNIRWHDIAEDPRGAAVLTTG
jgi:hypothetical protein